MPMCHPALRSRPDVVQNVLCCYSANSVQRTGEEYESDLQRIRTAFATDSEQARRKLVEGLRKASFLRAVNAQTGEVRFLKPEVVYRPTQRMKAAFTGVKAVWFVDDRLTGLRGESVRELLQACGVHDVLRTTQCKSALTWRDKQELRRKRWNQHYTRDRIEGERDSAEVAEFLNLLSKLTKEAAQERAIEFWLLLRDTLQDRRESYFRARYVWGYYHQEWWCTFPAAWVARLRNAHWVPDAAGILRRPDEICISEAHEKIREAADAFLTEILGFRPEAIKELAKKEGIEIEVLSLIKLHHLSAERLRQLLAANREGEEAEERETNKTLEREDHGGRSESGSVRDKETSGNGGESGGYGHSDEDGTGSGGGFGKKGLGGSRTKFYTYVGVSDTSDPGNDEHLPEDKRREIEEAAISFILTMEPTLSRTPLNNPGFDLFEGESVEFVVRFVEVKSKKGEWNGSVALSEEQFRLADKERERFWLYVVEFARDPTKRCLYKIQDPAGKSQYFTFDAGWKALAEQQNQISEKPKAT
jgi:uncharacterized protein DUF3883